MSIINSFNVSSYLSIPTALKKTQEGFKDKSVSKAENEQSLTPNEEMNRFKEEFYKEIDKIKCHSTVKNATVNISDKAFENMKENPQYREKIMSLLERDLGSSYAPRNTSVMLTVGESLNQYRGDSWPTSNDSEFWWRSEHSFYKMTDDDSNYERKKISEDQLRLFVGQNSFALLNVIKNR